MLKNSIFLLKKLVVKLHRKGWFEANWILLLEIIHFEWVFIHSSKLSIDFQGFVSAIGENFKKFSQSSQIKKMCFTPNICLLKSCRGYHLMIDFNRRIEIFELHSFKNLFKFVSIDDYKYFDVFHINGRYLSKSLRNTIEYSETFWSQNLKTTLIYVKIKLSIIYLLYY